MLPDLLSKCTIKLILWFWKSCRYCNGRCAETEVFTFVRAWEAANYASSQVFEFPANIYLKAMWEEEKELGFPGGGEGGPQVQGLAFPVHLFLEYLVVQRCTEQCAVKSNTFFISSSLLCQRMRREDFRLFWSVCEQCFFLAWRTFRAVLFKGAICGKAVSKKRIMMVIWWWWWLS